MVRSYQNFDLITQKHAGPSAARNLGVKQSRGTHVVFIDSDCIAKNDFLMQIDKEYADCGIAGVGGKQLPPSDDSDFGKAIARFSSRFQNLSDT
jgi:glycosyltransferase involved in cell wall biosynthesis